MIISVCNKQEMIKVGWSECGPLRSFDPEFQKKCNDTKHKITIVQGRYKHSSRYKQKYRRLEHRDFRSNNEIHTFKS